MRGFTLTELLITIGLGVILVAAAAPVYGIFQISAQLNGNTSQLVQTLRLARQRSISGYNSVSHGVIFYNQSYTLVQSTFGSPYNHIVNLEDSLNLSWLLSNASNTLWFSSVGLPNATGTITLTHSISGERKIIINSLGLIEELKE